MKRILVIQTAYIGDVILATALVESLKDNLPETAIDFVLRKGNESLLENNPAVSKVISWDKKNGKYRSLRIVASEIRKSEYDLVINLHRYASSGFLTWRSKASLKLGFRNNPLHFLFHKKIDHDTKSGKHEVERNIELARLALPDLRLKYPKLFPSNEDIRSVTAYLIQKPFVVMAPASVWFTKQLPAQKWVELIQKQPKERVVLLVGAPGDQQLLDRICSDACRLKVYNLAGKISLKATAALMKDAEMNYVNDSAPLHLASAMNAPVTAFFCSTVPSFGFGPLSDVSRIAEVSEQLACRPCGIHGYPRCPLGHFNCGNQISINP